MLKRSFIIFILLSSVGHYLVACICFIPDLEEHFKMSDQIFSAKVIDIGCENGFYPTYNFGGGYVTLEVIQGFKNSPPEAKGTRISVIVSDVCHYSFKLNNTYVLFGEFVSSKDIIMIGECSVKPMASFNELEELVELSEDHQEDHKNPVESVEPIDSEGDESSKIALFAIISISIVLNLFLFFRSKK